MHLKTLWDIAQQILQFCGGFGEMARVILSHSFLELAVLALGLLCPCYKRRHENQGEQIRTQQGPRSNTHGLHAITRPQTKQVRGKTTKWRRRFLEAPS